MELIRYVRPSRYAESDRLLPTPYAEFGGVQARNCCTPWQLVFASSATSADPPGDRRRGDTAAPARVCRDFAHLAISLLRSKTSRRLPGVCARLSPMDFHAWPSPLNGAWHSSTHRLARAKACCGSRRARLLGHRVPFHSGGSLSLTELKVTAVVNGELPQEDPASSSPSASALTVKVDRVWERGQSGGMAERVKGAPAQSGGGRTAPTDRAPRRTETRWERVRWAGGHDPRLGRREHGAGHRAAFAADEDTVRR